MTDGFPAPPSTRAAGAFCFNLDAELELADASYRTPRATARLIRRRVQGLQGLLCPNDVAIIPGEDTRAEDLDGRAWCPTPSALSALSKAGAQPAPAPDPAILRAVNHRAFGLAVERDLDGGIGAQMVSDLNGLQALVATPLGRRAGGWRVKPALSFAGRGQVLLPRRPNDEDVAACEALLATGCLVEPELERLSDFALHGYLTRTGAYRLGQPIRQHCDADGVYRSSELARAGSLTAQERHELQAGGVQVVEALRAAGYFGPFGIDAMRYRSEEGATRLRPIVEVNARYTMAWARGFHAEA